MNYYLSFGGFSTAPYFYNHVRGGNAPALRAGGGGGGGGGGGNAAWVTMEFGPSAPDEVARSEPHPATLTDLKNTFFVPGVGFAEKGKVERILFPLVLDTWAAHPSDFRQAPPCNLKLLGGHALLQAWWLAMFEALREERTMHVQALWQCCLTATIRVRSDTQLHKLILHTLQFSEGALSVQRNLADNFLLFARKVRQLCDCRDVAPSGQAELLKWLISLQVKFNGALINKTSFHATELVHKHVNPSCTAVLAKIEAEFGGSAVQLVQQTQPRHPGCCEDVNSAPGRAIIHPRERPGRLASEGRAAKMVYLGCLGETEGRNSRLLGHDCFQAHRPPLHPKHSRPFRGPGWHAHGRIGGQGPDQVQHSM